MAISPLAGKPAPKDLLVDLAALERAYFERWPDPDAASQAVSFGTSGHRGSSLRTSFNEAHIAAITQALCEYRSGQGIDGPLYLGEDTDALSGPAQRTALEVLVANGVATVIQRDDGVTPTPVVSRAILVYNQDRRDHFADGIVVTPSHNPPDDGGFKYNPPNGGPADTDVTRWVQDRANALLRARNEGVKRVPYEHAFRAGTTREEDFILPYVEDLRNVVDMDAIRDAHMKLAVDPLGGAAVYYWEAINRIYGLDIDVVNPAVDPTFSFMTVDHDEQSLRILPITARLTKAPGNDAPIGGLKVVTKTGWFAARPSGTENIYKIYAESFRDEAHLDTIVHEAQQIVTDALGDAKETS